MEEKQQKIKIRHSKAPNYATHYATSAMLAGPTQDGFYHLIFYADTIGLQTETGTLNGDGVTYAVSIEDGDLQPQREDKVCISVTEDVLKKSCLFA